MPQIVTVNVTLTQAPTPPTLQKTGALVSQGATVLTAGTSFLLTQLSDLTPILRGSASLTSLSWSGGVVTATTASPHGFAIGDELDLTIAGAVPTGYNGTYLCSITGASTFTYMLATNPGTMTAAGSYTIEDVAELQAMATTFFAQGSQTAVYVLELGAGSVADGVAALTNYLTENPNSAYNPGDTGYFYGYLVPRTWDADPDFLDLIASFESTTARTYFWVTTTLATYKNYTPLMKDVIALIECPQTSIYATQALQSLSWSTGAATATTSANHGVAVGDWFQITGCSPSGFNGYWQAQPGTAGNTLVWAIATNPGAETILGSLIGSQVASSGVPSTEFTLAAAFRAALHYDPSSTNKVAPFAFQYVFGVTPFPTKGNSSLLTTLKAASINYVAVAAEGGITNTALFWGTTMDARDFTYWYSIDWAAINIDINIANTIINGSNNPINPLYYDQNGINRLQDAAVDTLASAISFGLANGQLARSQLNATDFINAIDNGDFDGQIVVNAVPLVPYLKASPGDYKIGKYAGLSAQYIPNRGFIEIIFNINVTDFIAS